MNSLICTAAEREREQDILAQTSAGGLVRLVAEDREDDRRGEQAGGAVADGHADGVAPAVVLPRVVRGHRDDAAERETEREEDLTRRVEPNLRLEQLLELHSANTTQHATFSCSSVQYSLTLYKHPSSCVTSHFLFIKVRVKMANCDSISHVLHVI